QKIFTDPTRKVSSFADLINKTIELTQGPGTGVLLDVNKPRDLFDRFWMITDVQTIAGDSAHMKLVLQNPSQVDPSLLRSTASSSTSAGTQPTTATKYAI